jgi:O-antigen ligase
LSYLAFYYSSLALLQSEADVKATAKVLMGSTLVICIASFWQFITNDPGTLWHLLYDNDEVTYVWVRRVTSLFKTENQFAGYLNWMISLGFGFSFLRGDRALRILSISASATGLVALLLTQSRGALIGFVGIVVLSLIILPLSARQRTLWITSCTALALVTFGSLSMLPDRFSTVDFQALTRLTIFGVAIDLIRGSPWTGIGYGGFPAYTVGLLPDMIDTHNLYLKLWAETGIVGMLAYIWMKANVVRIALEVRHTSPVMYSVAFAVLAGTTAEMIHGMVDVFLEVIPVSCVAWMLIAMLTAPNPGFARDR